MNMRAVVIQNESKFLQLTFNVIHETSVCHIFSSWYLQIDKYQTFFHFDCEPLSRICAFVFSEENSHLQWAKKDQGMTKGHFFQKRHLSHQNISMLSHAAEQWADKVFFLSQNS